MVPGEGAAVAVVVGAQIADAGGGDLKDLNLGLFDGLLSDGRVDLEQVGVASELVVAVVVTDRHVDSLLTGELGEVEQILLPGGAGSDVRADLGHLSDVVRGAGEDAVGLGVGGHVVLQPDADGGGTLAGQVDGGRNGPVVGSQSGAALVGSGLDAVGAFHRGSGLDFPVEAVAVGVDKLPALFHDVGLKAEAVDQVAELGVGILFLFHGLGQLELVQAGVVAGRAVAADPEGAVVVDGQLVGHGVGAGHALQGDDRHGRQSAGEQIHGVDGVVVAQSVQGLVLVVEGHVVDDADGLVVLADHHDLVHVRQLGDTEPAVGAGHEDVAVHILSGTDRAVEVGEDVQAFVGAGAVVVPQLVLGDLPHTVAGAGSRGGLIGDEAQEQTGVGIFAAAAAAQADLEGSLVAGVVADQEDDLIGQGLALEIQRNLDLFAGAVLLGHGLEVDLAAGLVGDSDVGNVVVVLRSHEHVAGDEILQGADNHGGGIVDDDVILDARVLADHAGLEDVLEAFGIQTAGGGDLAVQLGVHDAVVLGQSVEADGDLVVLGHARGGQSLAHVVAGGGGVLPASAVDIVVGGVLPGRSGLGVQDLAVGVGHGEAQGGGVADVQVGEGLDGVGAVHGQPLSGELVLDDVGVAHVDQSLALGVLHGQVVDVLVADIGLLAGAVGLVDDGGAVQHVGVGVGADLELRAVGGQAAGQRGGHARAQVAADDRCAHEADLGFLLPEETDEDVGVGGGGIGEEHGVVKDEELVDAVGEDLLLHLALQAGARGDGVEFHAQFVRQLAALGKQFLGYFGDLCAFGFAIYKYVVHTVSQ